MGKSPFHGGRTGTPGPWYRLEYSAERGGFTIVVTTAGGAKERFPITIGELMAIDMLTRQVGHFRYSPFDDSLMVPEGRPMPSPTESGYQEAVRLFVYIRGRLMPWVITSQYVLRRMWAFQKAYENFAEAEHGLIPVCEVGADELRPSNFTEGEFFKVPGLIVVNWMEHDLVVFGYPTVRPPLVKLAETEPPVALPATPAAQLPAAPPPPPTPPPTPPPPAPANDAAAAAPLDGGGVYRPVPTPAAPQAAPPPAAPVVAPANDLLARYARKQL